MPGLSGVQRALRRLFTGRDAPAAGDAQASNDTIASSLTTRTGAARLRDLYQWARGRMLAARRHNELVMMEEARKVHQAKRRALGLLLGLLNQEQRQEFQSCRYFHVIGGRTGTRYRIRVASFANIDVLDPSGSPMYRLCAHPAGDIPVYDVMAAQMLHLQDATTEERFLRQANVHTALSEMRVHGGPSWVP